jgi:hypothetical protein
METFSQLDRVGMRDATSAASDPSIDFAKMLGRLATVNGAESVDQLKILQRLAESSKGMNGLSSRMPNLQVSNGWVSTITMNRLGWLVAIVGWIARSLGQLVPTTRQVGRLSAVAGQCDGFVVGLA